MTETEQLRKEVNELRERLARLEATVQRAGSTPWMPVLIAPGLPRPGGTITCGDVRG